MTNKTTKLTGSLLINGLELTLHLGWPDAEREKQQTVMVNIEINFPVPPRACETDQLTDTLCYSILTRDIHQHFTLQHFHLVEYLAKSLHQFIMAKIPAQSLVKVEVIKRPTIPGLTGFVQFSYGETSSCSC